MYCIIGKDKIFFRKTKLEQLNQNVTDNLFTLSIWYLISQFL
jgi:hypothetical protein